MTKDWNTQDPSLQSDAAPHELCGVLRMHRNGMPSKKIMSMLSLRGTKLIKTIEVATEAEKQAVKEKRPIHNELIPKEKS